MQGSYGLLKIGSIFLCQPPTYANNEDALNGLAPGNVYKTPSGELRIVV